MTEDNKNPNVENDYEYSRRVLYDLIEKGTDALESMIEVARESEHPRAFEVLSGLIKNTADVNDKLLDLNKKHKDINAKETPPAVEGGTTNNNVFIGSTSDLQRMLQDVNKTVENNVVDITPRLKDE
jgi:hypothetical protein